MTNETLSERFAALFSEYEAENMGALGHLNCLKIGLTAIIHTDDILAALRAAERPTASPDAAEAARAMMAAGEALADIAHMRNHVRKPKSDVNTLFIDARDWYALMPKLDAALVALAKARAPRDDHPGADKP